MDEKDIEKGSDIPPRSLQGDTSPLDLPSRFAQVPPENGPRKYPRGSTSLLSVGQG
jgi:hypothetical protein